MVDLFLKFAVRTIFIRVLTVELLGLNGLFSNILQVLSLTELGVGTALTFSMYKPMAENNTEKISALYRFYRKIYLIIVAIIVGVGICITPFLKYLINGEVPETINLYIIYFIFIANTALSYLSAHKKSLILAAQRQDLNSKSEIVKTVFLNITQTLALLIFRNYYTYIVFLPLSTVLEYFVINVIALKNFPQICRNKNEFIIDCETKQEIKRNTFAILFHKIGGTLVYSTDNILISSLLGLTVLGIYSNYYLIVTGVTALISAFLNGVKGSVGNLVAKEDAENIEQTFKKMNFIYMWIVGLFSTCLGCLFQPFIKLWVGTDFIFNNSTMILLVISFYLNVSKYMIYSYKECAGLLTQDKYRPIFEVIINLVFSIVLCKFIGVNGIILGTIISTICGPLITEPYVVYKYLFRDNVRKYYLKYILNSIVFALIFAIIFYFCNLVKGFSVLSILLRLVICGVGFNILYLVVVCWTKDFKNSFNWIKGIIKKK